ncbi:MAG: hypothetical protein RI911_12 [Candidatus Parcubacteria bacterium]|jgi:diaminopimelate epimerase
MHLARVVIAYPSGNTTAVVFDDVPGVDRKKLNQAVSEAWAKRGGAESIEQCCFVTKAQDPSAIGRVEMFGGEFCGNATRSVVFLLTQGNEGEGIIESSGTKQSLRFSMKDGIVSVQVPLLSSEYVQSDDSGYVVRLDGITHVVRFVQEVTNPRVLLQDMLDTNYLNLRSEPAVGVSLYHQDTGRAAFCVWVNAVDTIFDETACGSGTASIGIALATKQHKAIEVPVTQPSGETIKVSVITDSHTAIGSVHISGRVSILYDGPLDVVGV